MTYTTESFVSKAKQKFPDLDFSQVKYKGSSYEIIIKCKEHGYFKKMAGSLFRSKGCPKCSMSKEGTGPRLTTKQFIKKALRQHGNKYTYGKTTYLGSTQTVIVTCKTHGDFKVIAGQHIRSSRSIGCAKCSLETKRGNLENFVAKAKRVHGNIYDYSKSIYVNSYTPVEVICRTHGSFFITPNSHTSGNKSGCGYCWREVLRNGNNWKYKKKTYVLGSREVYVQGYEPFALDYLQQKMNIPVKHIKVSGDVPSIRYYDKQEQKRRTYHPDILIEPKKHLVEVKSHYTLLVRLDELKAKRKACVKKGFKFSVWLFNKRGIKLPVPKDWYLMSRDDLKKKIS